MQDTERQAGWNKKWAFEISWESTVQTQTIENPKCKYKRIPQQRKYKSK